MRPWQRIAATEILEQRRQPAMLFVLVANYLLWLLVFGGTFVALDFVLGDPLGREMLDEQLAGSGVELDAMIRVAVSTYGSLSFTNLPLFVSIFAGNSVLHERNLGTLPFLLLAPLGRRELLVGKLAGAMAIPLGLHLVFVGAGCFLFGRIDLVDDFPLFGGGPAFWVGYLLGAPASTLFVGALGTVISALSRDVRTSMQTTSFLIGLFSLGIGYALVDGLSEGVAFELVFAASGLGLAAFALEIGARAIGRDFA